VFFKRALAIREKQLGPDHPQVALGLNNLAELYRAQGRYADAEPLNKRSLTIYENQLGSEHPSVTNGLNNLAFLYRTQGRYVDALPYARRAFSLIRKRLTQGDTESLGARAEKDSQRKSMTFLLSILSKLPTPLAPDLANDGFAALQLAASSSTGEALAQTAARFAAKGGALGELILQRQSLQKRLQPADANLLKALNYESQQAQSGGGTTLASGNRPILPSNSNRSAMNLPCAFRNTQN